MIYHNISFNNIIKLYLKIINNMIEAFQKLTQIDFYKNINKENKSNYIKNIRIGNEYKSLLEQNYVNSICATIEESSESGSIGLEFKTSDSMSIDYEIYIKNSSRDNESGNTSTNYNTKSGLTKEEQAAIDQVYSKPSCRRQTNPNRKRGT